MRRDSTSSLVDAVVALQRVGHHEDLLGEGRVGERLLVAGHRGAEDDLAVRARRGADGVAGEDGAVFEDEEGT